MGATSGLLALMWFYGGNGTKGIHVTGPVRGLAEKRAEKRDALNQRFTCDTVYEVFTYDTTGLDADDMKGRELEMELYGDVRHTLQYRILLARRQKMKLWAANHQWLALPEGATIIDERTINTIYGRRTLVAWMTYLQTTINCYEGDDDPEFTAFWYATQGSGYFKGLLHFTLIDPARKKLINTVEFKDYYSGRLYKTNRYSSHQVLTTYPFSIANPAVNKRYTHELWYKATGGSAHTDGEADVLHFFDFNGDGKPHEFLLYDQVANTCCETSLLGYNEAKDSFFSYRWDVTEFNHDSTEQTKAVREKWEDWECKNQFSYLKQITYGKVRVSSWRESRPSAELLPERFTQPLMKFERFDQSMIFAMEDYTYEEVRYEKVKDRYSMMLVRVPL